MKILIIDNTVELSSWGAPELVALCVQAKPSNSVFVRRAIPKDLPQITDQFSHLILSGSMTQATDRSPWTLLLEEWIQQWMHTQKPLLGICFGHQILARTLGASVGLSQQPEKGWITVRQTRQNRLLQGLEKSFHTFAWHQDEVTTIPPGCFCSAETDACKIQGIEMEALPVFGVQFHPERNPKNAQKNGATGSPAMYDPNVGFRMIKNFLSL